MLPRSCAIKSSTASAGSASPRSRAMSATDMPWYFWFAGVRDRASTIPSHHPCSLAQAMKSGSFLMRSRSEGSRSRSANLSGPPSLTQRGKNALQP